MVKLNANQVTNEHRNHYIRLGGRGIVDGLKGEAFKDDLYKILTVITSPGDERIILRGYRARRTKYLPACNYDQQVEIYTSKEFKSLRSISDPVQR